jgi:5-methylcytosine-specific restriction endonuclease McrA
LRYARTRYAQMQAMASGPIDRDAIIARDNSTCYICGKKLITGADVITLDHVIPLARGGAHDATNLRVACVSCNARKGKRLPRNKH